MEQTKQKYFSFDDTVLIGISIGKLLKMINYNDSQVEKLIMLKNFQDLVITINVDYSNLSTYYEHLIIQIYKKSKRKDILEFCKGVLNISMYLKNKDIHQFHRLHYNDNFHPILKSRIYSQEILKHNKNVINELNYYFEINEKDGQVSLDYFFEIIFSSIVTKNFKVMAWLIKKISSQKNYKHFFKFEHYQNFIFMKLLFHNQMLKTCHSLFVSDFWK